jgi:hypothetical protein
MDILKNKTPTDIFFSSIKSEDPDEFIGTEKEAEEELSSRSRRGRGRRGRGGEESKDNKNKKETTGLESYGRKREISIEGYCFQKDKREASARVTKLADMLLSSGGGMFFEVRQDYGKWVEDTEELIKFFKGSGELQRIKKCSPAFHFRLVCTVVDRGAAGR